VILITFKIIISIRAWGCKIKSPIEVESSLEKMVIKQGEDLIPKFNIIFDPDDIPKAIEIVLEPEPGSGFELDAPLRLEPSEANVSVELPLKYSNAKTGEYSMEFNFRHAEFGTELAEVFPVNFEITAPEIEIIYCRTTEPQVSKGQEFEIQIGFNYPAPEKLRGIVYGRLVTTENLVHKLYELEPKRVSIIGEKEISWTEKIPYDELQTGKLNAIVEFKSKSTFRKREFEDLIEIRQARAIRINSVTSSKSILSPEDAFEISAEIENIGLEELKLEVYPKIEMPLNGKIGSREETVPTVGTTSPSHLDKDTGWVLPAQEIVLSPDSIQEVKWSWEVPKDAMNGKYKVHLHRKDLKTNESGKFSQELFEIRPHHEVKIHNAVPSGESFGIGGEAEITVQVSDTGTRAGIEGEGLKLHYAISDILNQGIIKKIRKIKTAEGTKEYRLLWPIPDEIEAGKYDLKIRITQNEIELASKKFSKLINIELPVKLDIHLMVPKFTISTKKSKVNKLDSNINPYLLEHEEISGEMRHKSLSIYKLNSNTHLYLLNNNLIIYTPASKSTTEDLQEFGGLLFSHLLGLEFLDSDVFEDDLTFWVRSGYLWSNLVLGGERFLKIQNQKAMKSKIKDLSSREPTAENLQIITQAIFKKTFENIREKKSKMMTTKMFKGSARHSMELNEIFDSSVVSDKSLTGTDDMKLIESIMNYLTEYAPEINPKLQTSRKIAKDPKQKKVNPLLYELSKTFENSIKFRTKKTTHILQKRSNRVLGNWLSQLKKGRIRRQPNKKLAELLQTSYIYVLAYLSGEVVNILRNSKKTNHLPPWKFYKLTLFEILYFYLLMHYQKSQAKYKPNLSRTELAADLNPALNELRKANQKYWYYHQLWQAKCVNYLKNIAKRWDLAQLREHLKITTNPVILHGMRGAKGNTRLILGNNGSKEITIYPNLALPSIHWNLLEPAARTNNEVYQLERLSIEPKQVKEIPITVSIPRSLSFNKYSAILKIYPKPIKLIPEIE
jgi:hypothetical protein